MPVAYLLPISDYQTNVHHTDPTSPSTHYDKVDDLPPGTDQNATTVYTKFVGIPPPPKPHQE